METAVNRDEDEELALFLEMRRREKSQGVSPCSPPGPNDVDDASRGSSIPKTTCSVPRRRTAVEKFLDSENDKSDYDWLIAPPALLQHEKEPEKSSTVELKEPNAQPAVLKPRRGNIPDEPVLRSSKASKPTSVASGLNSSTAVNKKALTFGQLKASSRATIHAATKPSRQVTPTSRATSPALKLNGARSRSSISARSSPRSSIPNEITTLPASKFTPRSATPTPMSLTASGASNQPASSLTRSSSVEKSAPEASSSASKLSVMPGRPVSASRVRGATGTNSSAVTSRASERSRVQSKTANDVNPVLMGTKMVERVVNMRKLPPPKQDDQNSAGKSASFLDGSGFGRSLSRSSLDMALRHMDIRRTISGNLRVTINKAAAPP